MGAIRFTARVESISAHEARVISTATPGRMSCHASVDSEKSAGQMIVAEISQGEKRSCLKIASRRAATPLVAASGCIRHRREHLQRCNDHQRRHAHPQQRHFRRPKPPPHRSGRYHDQWRHSHLQRKPHQEWQCHCHTQRGEHLLRHTRSRCRQRARQHLANRGHHRRFPSRHGR